jgi:hypothetical protein
MATKKSEDKVLKQPTRGYHRNGLLNVTPKGDEEKM